MKRIMTSINTVSKDGSIRFQKMEAVQKFKLWACCSIKPFFKRHWNRDFCASIIQAPTITRLPRCHPSNEAEAVVERAKKPVRLRRASFNLSFCCRILSNDVSFLRSRRQTKNRGERGSSGERISRFSWSLSASASLLFEKRGMERIPKHCTQLTFKFWKTVPWATNRREKKVGVGEDWKLEVEAWKKRTSSRVDLKVNICLRRSRIRWLRRIIEIH